MNPQAMHLRNAAIHKDYRSMERDVKQRMPPAPAGTRNPARGYGMLRRAPMYVVAYELEPGPFGIRSESHGFTVIGDIGQGAFSGLHYTGVSGDHTRTSVHIDDAFIAKVQDATVKGTHMKSRTGMRVFNDDVLEALDALKGRDYPSKELFAPEYMAVRRREDPSLTDAHLEAELKQLAFQTPEGWMQHWPRVPNLGHPAGRGWVTLDEDNVDLIKQAQRPFASGVLNAIDALAGRRFSSRETFAAAYDAERRKVDHAISDTALATERESLFGTPKAKGNIAERDTQKMEDLSGEDYYTGKVFDRAPVLDANTGQRMGFPHTVKYPEGDHLVPREHIDSGSTIQLEGGSFRRLLGADPLAALEMNNEAWKWQRITDTPLRRDGRMQPTHDDEGPTLLGRTHEGRMNIIKQHPTYKMYPPYDAGEGNCNSGVRMSMRDAGIAPENMKAASTWSFGFRQEISMFDPMARQKKLEEADPRRRDPERDTREGIDKSPIRGERVRIAETSDVFGKSGLFSFRKGKVDIANRVQRDLSKDEQFQRDLNAARPRAEDTPWKRSTAATLAASKAIEQNRHLPKRVRDSIADHNDAEQSKRTPAPLRPGVSQPSRPMVGLTATATPPEEPSEPTSSQSRAPLQERVMAELSRFSRPDAGTPS